MAQMCPTPRARNLNTPHTVAVVFVCFNRTRVCRQKEAGPAAARLKLRIRLEQLRAARHAMVGSVIVVMVERA